MNKDAAADVIPIRQANQYNCMVSSLVMSLRANGVADEESTPELVNKVMGAMPMHGASWEQAFAASQHYGMRVTFICPATLRQVKEYTDRGIPVMIAWNPEGRPWGHASVIFDVDDELNVKIADPNCPDPDQTVRVVPKTEFYGKWYEKFGDSYLIRREAMAVEREITPDGRQMVASGIPVDEATKLVLRACKPLDPTLLRGLGVPGTIRVLSPKSMYKFHLPADQVWDRTEVVRLVKAVPGIQSIRGDDEFAFALPGVDLHKNPTNNYFRVVLEDQPEYKPGMHAISVIWSGNDTDNDYDVKRRKLDQKVAAHRPIRGYTDQVWTMDQWGTWEVPGLNRLAKQLTKVYVVVDPSDKETGLGDMVFSVTPIEMSEYVVGTGPRRWRSEHTALHDDEKSALDDAKARLKKLHGGKPPEHLMQPSQISHLRAAGKKPQPVAPSKKDDKTLLITPSTPRNEITRRMLERGQGGAGGSHRNRDFDVAKGRERQEKHKKDWREKDAVIDWKGVAKKLLAAVNGTTQDDLHYRAYLREVIAGRPADHLVKKFKGAAAARQDLIDNAGKTATTLSQPLSTRPDYGSFTGDQKMAAKTEVEKAEKPGQWNLKIYKSRATRWDYFLENPQGGGGGRSSYTSVKAAILAAITGVNFQGADKIWLIIANWDPQVGDYKVIKTTWLDPTTRPEVLRVASAYLRKNIGD